MVCHLEIIMIENSLCKQSEINDSSPHLESTPKLSYFDVISNRLDSWEVKQQAIKEQKLTKSVLIKDTDTITGISKTFRLTIELVSTEQVDAQQHQLELMEGFEYVS